MRLEVADAARPRATRPQRQHPQRPRAAPSGARLLITTTRKRNVAEDSSSWSLPLPQATAAAAMTAQSMTTDAGPLSLKRLRARLASPLHAVCAAWVDGRKTENLEYPKIE